MAFNTALYYPASGITSGAWLKSAMVYWDEIRTLVAVSDEKPFKDAISREFAESGALVPIAIRKGMPESKGMMEEVYRYLGTPNAKFMASPDYAPGGFEELSEDLASLGTTDYFGDNIASEIIETLQSIGFESDESILRVPNILGRYYLTLLASRIAPAAGADLLSDDVLAHSLTRRVLLGAGRIADFTRDVEQRIRTAANPMPDDPKIPTEVSDGIVIDLTLKRVDVDPETPVRQIIDFRRKHTVELDRFREAIEAFLDLVRDQLAGGELPLKGVQDACAQAYADDFEPPFSDYRSCLRTAGINFVSRKYLTISALYPERITRRSGMGLETAYPLLIAPMADATATVVQYRADQRIQGTKRPVSFWME